MVEPNPLSDELSAAPSKPRLSNLINDNQLIDDCEDLKLEDGEAII